MMKYGILVGSQRDCSEIRQGDLPVDRYGASATTGKKIRGHTGIQAS